MKPIDLEGAGAIQRVTTLGFPWVARDPFLFTVHHVDSYPAGNEAMGPATTAGKVSGFDMGTEGWRMYHGERVPGFPGHPHRGFETVTLVVRGFVDHADSLGAIGRYGEGDVQWLTTGRGVQHAEMFPLRDARSPNPLELFQIWFNLPAANKMVAPNYAMLWREAIPRHTAIDTDGRTTEVTIVAGDVDGAPKRAAPPPPSSWAARDVNDVAIWTLKMSPHARYTLPAARPGTNRDLFFHRGRSLRVGGSEVSARHGVQLRGDARVTLENGDAPAELLMLQGRPIGEPVVQHGPFVMNTRDEIAKAFDDYRRTSFGGWPWDREDPVLPREEGRFARHADGRVERL